MAPEKNSQDIHICGSCRTEFSDILEFIQHKKNSCGSREINVHPQASQLTVQETAEEKTDTESSSATYTVKASDSLSSNIPVAIGSHEEPESLHHKTFFMSDSPENGVLTSEAINSTGDHTVYLPLEQLCKGDNSMVRYYPYQSFSPGTQVSQNKNCLQLRQNKTSEEESMPSQPNSSQKGQADRFSTDGIAVYIVSPKSFASTAITPQETLHSNCHVQVSKASDMSVQRETTRTVVSMKNGLSGYEQAKKLCLKMECRPSCAQDSSRCIFPESGLASGSDNSTPCPEDLEVGQISASMLEQQAPRAPQGSGRTFPSGNSSSSAAAENSPNTSNQFPPYTDTGSACTVTVSLPAAHRAGLSYIRQNTASAPTVVSFTDEREKRGRLQGLSDDLLENLNTDSPARNLSSDVVFQRTNISKAKSTNCTSSSSSLPVQQLPLTGFKAVFTSPSRSGHRLSPAQDVDLILSDTSKISHHMLKGLVHSQDSQNFSSSRNTTIYKNISAAAKVPRNLNNGGISQNFVPQSFSQKLGLKRGAERQITFDNGEIPTLKENKRIAISSQSKSYSHAAPVMNYTTGDTFSQKLPLNSVPGLNSITSNIKQNPVRTPNSVTSTNTSITAITPLLGQQVIAIKKSPVQTKPSHACPKDHSVTPMSVCSSHPQHEKPVTTQTNSETVMVYKNGDGNVVMAPKNVHAMLPSHQLNHNNNSGTVQYYPVLSQIVMPSNLPDQSSQQVLLQLQGGEHQFQQEHGNNPISNVIGASSLERSVESREITCPISIPLKHKKLTNSAQSVVYMQTPQVSSSIPCPPPLIFHGATSAVPPTSVKTRTLTARENVNTSVSREPYIIKPKKRLGKQIAPNLDLVSPLWQPGLDEEAKSCTQIQESKKERRFTCKFDKCRYSSSLYKDIERHTRTHTGERPFRCHQCGKTFNRSDKLIVHQRWHEGTKPFQCNFCDYKTLESGSLKKHLRIHSNERPYKCQVCPYASRNSSHLIVHLRTHTGDAPFICSVCNAQFKINSDLKRHMRTHTGEKPFKCDHCDYRSTNKGNLKTHVRINHSKAHEQCCEHCDFTSSSRKRLREHSKTHDPSRVFRCQQCTHTCSSAKALRAHLCIHDTVKPYQCSFCPYSCKQSGNLKKHVQNLHMDKLQKTSGRHKGKKRQMHYRSAESRDGPKSKVKVQSEKHVEHFKQHKCTQCGCGFVRIDSLRSHMNQHKHAKEQEVGLRSKRHKTSPLQKSVSSKLSPSLVCSGTKPLASSPFQPGRHKTSMQYIAAAASKLFEENYMSPEQATSVRSGDKGCDQLHSDARFSSRKGDNAHSSAPTFTAMEANGVQQLSLALTLSKSQNRSDIQPERELYAASVQEQQHLPWEHGSYTISLQASPNKVCHIDKSSFDMHSVVEPTSLSPQTSPISLQNKLSNNRLGLVSNSTERVCQQTNLPGSFVRQCSDNSAQQGKQQHQLVIGNQLEQPITQQLAATDTAMIKLKAAKDVKQSLVFTHQEEDTSSQEASFNFQLVPQVLTPQADSSQTSVLAQHVMHPVVVPQAQAQVQPVQHIQIVWQGVAATTAQSEVAGLPASQQHIMLQDCGPNQVEVLSIPYNQLRAGPTSGQIPAGTKVFQVASSTGSISYEPEQAQQVFGQHREAGNNNQRRTVNPHNNNLIRESIIEGVKVSDKFQNLRGERKVEKVVLEQTGPADT
ncbi:Zinc finger protein 64 [Plakobranchus ocellatus]|uniref:Zinc finger protein 64 n=1 Tax=Plakobranchus ocellatus TaxID=259542 RepID=A0AAV4DHJ2_9GAST|nr:Zinc finger protein 64 [Plakobranchus ocellatus]